MPEPLSDEDRERLTQLLSAQEWIFARTMAYNPHWYTLRRNWQNDADFIWAVQMIRKHGQVEPFRGRPYIVLYLGDYKYWTMGCPIHPDPFFDSRRNTILINRKPFSARNAPSSHE